MLPVGALRQDYDPEDWTKFTQPEQRTMMTLWCMMRSPLMIGAELTKLDAFTKELLTNADLLAIQKESFCAHPLYTLADRAAWIAPRKDGKGVYLALFNLSDEEAELSLCLREAEVADGLTATELWSKTETTTAGCLTAKLPAHDAAVWYVR